MADTFFHWVGALGAAIAASNTIFLFFTSRARLVVSARSEPRKGGFPRLVVQVVNMSYREARLWRIRLLGASDMSGAFQDVTPYGEPLQFTLTGCERLPHVMPPRSRIDIRFSDLTESLAAVYKHLRIEATLEDGSVVHGSVSISDDGSSTEAPMFLRL